MDPKRKARRSSILKTRNDGGSGDVNLENVGKDNTLSENLTGFLPKRRVSFCHTNQVKEFENTNSSTEGSLSKTTDFNQTMCDEMNMSVSMLDTSINVHQNYEETRCGGNDMSFDGEGLSSFSSACFKPSECRVKPTVTITNNEVRQWQYHQMPRSTPMVEILKTRNDGGSGDLNLENVGKDNTLSGNLTGFLPKRRVSFCHTNQVKEFENTNSSTEGSLSKTKDFNQTMCDEMNMRTMCDEMNMSVSMLDSSMNVHQNYEETRCGGNDMSFDGEGLSSFSSACFKPSECKGKPTVTITNNEVRQYHQMPRSTPMVFSQPDPESFLNPFGNGITTKRSSRQRVPQNKLSFGQFGSSKTPKRNRIASIVPPKPQQHQIVKMTSDANVQTSPMVPAPALKKTQEVGFNCTLGALDSKKFLDASLMTSPAYFSAPKSQQTTPGERELLEMESVGVGTSMIMTSPARESHDIKQTETLRSIAVDNSQYNMSLDQSSFRRQSEKTQNGVVEESYFFENTLPVQPTMCAAPVPASPQITANDVIPIDSEDEVSFAFKPAPTPGFEELLKKLKEYARMPDLDIFVKWESLKYAIDKLSRIAEHEWEDVLSCEKVKGFLGQDYIKAVNTHRMRLSCKEPLYVGAMKSAAEMKKRGIPLA